MSNKETNSLQNFIDGTNFVRYILTDTAVVKKINDKLENYKQNIILPKGDLSDTVSKFGQISHHHPQF